MEKKASIAIVRQLQAVFAASILILIISSAASYYSNNKLIETSQWVNHTNAVMLNADNLMSVVKDAETGERGYLLTHDSLFLGLYHSAYGKAMTNYNNLRQLTLDNPSQQHNLDLAQPLIEERFKEMGNLLKGISVRGNTINVAADTHDTMLMGKQTMDKLRDVFEDIKGEEQKLLKVRTQQQNAYSTYTPVLVLIASILSILISIIAYARIKRDIEDRIKKQKEDEAKYIDTSNRINVMEGITRQIADGNYSVRSLDDAKDDLGRISSALNDMAKSLEYNFKELEHRNWLQEGMVKLGNSMRGERFIKSICNKITYSMATYLNAQAGTLYVADTDLNMKLQGSYAISEAPIEIAPGEGMAGQAAINKEIIVSDKLPANYLKIKSSLGDTSPAYVIIAPILYGNDVMGVIELGMLHEPKTAEIEFIKNNTESIAIGINAALNYEKMQDLLEETQTQAEELQSQHNELENINAELEAQTEKLQVSEEELKVQQEELLEANNELEERALLLEERNQLISEKNLEVQRKAEELALSTKYKSEFLANMSHELRTPLNSILLLSRLLAENKDENLSNEQVEYAEVIRSSGNGLLSLIDEILDLSKIEAGKMNLEYEQVTVNEIVQDLKGLFEPIAKEKKLAFNIDVDKDVTDIIETDKLRLEQVLKNLLSNSLKFTREGSVSLHIYNDSTTAGFISFAVTDTGIGIAQDKQKLIFEAFQQADGSTRRKYGGTGLGLSISKELSKLLSGRIDIKSEPGAGSTFIISVPGSRQYIPIDILTEEEETESLEEAGSLKTEPGEDRTKYLAPTIPEGIADDRENIQKDDKVVLIVEDDTAFAKTLLEYTRRKHYKGIVTVRGDEALPLAKQYMPSGILLDIQLPVKSGWDVMEELKSDAQTRHIPVHIMSAHAVKNESLLKGAINFINKPVGVEQIQEIFNKLEYVLNRTSKKVLIVEENPKHANALAYFLETFNINSEVKNTVAESVQALNENVDCVILDMGIPDQKAYETLEQVKKNRGLENLPIIIFTGKSLSMVEEQRIKRYADSIVVKTAHSYQRLLDEVSLFLHLVEEKKPKPVNPTSRKAGALSDVLKDKTVLVVDDDVRNIFSLSKALEKLNMNIVTAIDGKEAIQKLRENKNVDMILLDMMMPEMDGYETAKRIRQNQDWKNLPIIAVTAKAMTGDREKCIKAGASDYITKPVDIDQLLSLLRVWLYESKKKN